MIKERLIPFATNLVESTRAIGYSFESALADIIDNSISKDASNIEILFDSNEPQYVAVIDDGTGMTAEELRQAMRYGSKNAGEKRSEDDLGRFGLGLKMASLSQCRKLTLITKCNNEINGARWDLDIIYDSNDWILQFFSNDDLANLEITQELEKKQSGTIVIWEDFDRLKNETNDIQRVFDEKIKSARDHLSLVFHRFLDSHGDARHISISMNGIAVTATDPYLLSNSATQRLEEERITIGDDVVIVKPYILPFRSKLSAKEKLLFSGINDLRQEQGFYIYRNKRLIIWGTWLKLIKAGELNKLARIRIDIPNSMDSMWNIDIKKSTASLPDAIKIKLRDIVVRAVGTSERVFKYRGRKINDNLDHVWTSVEERDKVVRYYINRDLPLYKVLAQNLEDSDLNTLNTLLDMIEDTFPYGDVYLRQARDQDIGKETDSEVIFANGLEYFKSLKETGNTTQTALQQLGRLDYMYIHKEILEKIKEEISNE